MNKFDMKAKAWADKIMKDLSEGIMQSIADELIINKMVDDIWSQIKKEQIKLLLEECGSAENFEYRYVIKEDAIIQVNEFRLAGKYPNYKIGDRVIFKNFTDKDFYIINIDGNTFTIQGDFDGVSVIEFSARHEDIKYK